MSHNESDQTTLERLKAKARRIVARSAREEALTRAAIDELTEADGLLAALPGSSAEEAPPEFVRSITTPGGEQQSASFSICGAVVTVAIDPRGEEDLERVAKLWNWLRRYTALRLSTSSVIRGNVRPFPLLEELPDEFAAISIRDDEKKIFAVNIRQANAGAALRRIRYDTLPVFAGVAAGQVSRALRTSHGASTTLVAAVAAASAAVGAVSLLPEREDSRHPPAAIRIVTLPPIAVTVTPGTAKKAPPTRASVPPSTGSARSRAPSAGPPRVWATPTIPASHRTTQPEVERSGGSPVPPRPSPSGVWSPVASRRPSPSPSVDPPPAEVKSGKDDCRGLIHIHYTNPRVEACLLG